MPRWRGDPRRFALGKRRRGIDAALRRLVDDAYEHVALFRARMDAAGIRPAAIQSVADLERLPLSDRQALASARQADYLRAGTDPATCRRAQTSGTTGTPIDIFMSHAESLYRRVLLLQAIRRNARLPIPFTIAEVGTGEVALRRRGLGQSFLFARVVRIPRLMPPPEQAKRAIAARPDVITGPPSCLEILADRLEEDRAAVAPRLVVSRGEVLHAATRAHLQEVFHCRVVDYYNCDEVGNVAWQCPDNPTLLHVNTDACVVEVVADSRRCAPGVAGRVVLTNLYNWTMPFIRYELGDRAALLPEAEEPCCCGHRGPSLSPIEGREGDYLWTTDGRRISPRSVDSLIALATLGEDAAGYAVRRYQVVQEEDSRFRVRVIQKRESREPIAERIATSLRRLDPNLRVEVEFVEDLPVETSGKFRAIYSKQRPPSVPASD
jgi:phenylacetate-CoA ligase